MLEPLAIPLFIFLLRVTNNVIGTARLILVSRGRRAWSFGFAALESLVFAYTAGQVITDLELRPDAPLLKSCGECVRCIEACPTGAIVAPYVIDNRRCISFLTIELRGAIPVEMRPLVGDWIFGCDICQDVCPVNSDVRRSVEPAFQQRHDFSAPELLPLLELDDEGFRERFRNSPVKRTKRTGLLRNVCVALGNIGDRRSVPALARTLRTADPMVRRHAAWALGRIGGAEAVDALSSAVHSQTDPEVLGEIESALGEAGAPVSGA